MRPETIQLACGCQQMGRPARPGCAGPSARLGSPCGGRGRGGQGAEALALDMGAHPGDERDRSSARGTCTTPYGQAVSDWRRAGDALRLNVRVPAGGTATVEVPTTSGEVRTPRGARPSPKGTTRRCTRWVRGSGPSSRSTRRRTDGR
ncbi:alpha-L-rhamnosidase C-terminal domain-containing protein [Streptomyces sp. N35]|uniref:alpha-L-rhamnosidase C-terminal domain-containing protein n=1 Tax=Streptomyces sp. N35 TaxID=2795730 RepID=UPI0035ABCCFD